LDLVYQVLVQKSLMPKGVDHPPEPGTFSAAARAKIFDAERR